MLYLVIFHITVNFWLSPHIQSVSGRDDLFPLEGSEDSTTPLQHPKSIALQRNGVSLVLSHDVNYEFEIPTHTSLELRELSTNTDRMEFYGRSNYGFISSVEKAFLQQVATDLSSNL